MNNTSNYFDSYFNSVLRNVPQKRLEPEQPLNKIKRFKNVGLSFYDCPDINNLQQMNTLEYLLPRTEENILVNVSEPVNRKMIDFLKYWQNDKIIFFADMVSDQYKDLFKTNISWFIRAENIYAEYGVCKKWLRQLHVNNWQKPYMFDCLLGRSRPHRDYLYKQIKKSKFIDKIFHTYYRSNDHLSKGIWDNKDYIFNNEIKFSDPQGIDVGVTRYARLPVSVYNQSYYSIVSETMVFNDFNQYTEKVAKPVVAMRPFIAFCGRHYLKNLRKLGFKTFGNVIDESYDDIGYDRERWGLAWDQVEWLCEQDPEHIYNELHSVLVHNKKHFLETDWHKNIKQVFL